MVSIKPSTKRPQQSKSIPIVPILVGATAILKEVASGGKSIHTIFVTHGILGGGPPDGDLPNDEDEGPSCGGPHNNGPPKSFQHVAYLNWYMGPSAPTLHLIQKSLL